MNKLIYFIIIIILLIGCKKDKPKEGKYEGFFNGTYIDSGKVVEEKRFEELYIIKSTKNYIEMKECIDCALESFKINKDKNNVSGILKLSSIIGADPGYVHGEITINGNWEKKDKSYFINGDFTYYFKIVDSPLTKTYTVNGNFEIKSI